MDLNFIYVVIDIHGKKHYFLKECDAFTRWYEIYGESLNSNISIYDLISRTFFRIYEG